MTTTIRPEDYLRVTRDRFVSYAQVIACTSPRVDSDGAITCESARGYMNVYPDRLRLHLYLYIFDDRHSMHRELSVVRLLDRFGILPPNKMLYASQGRMFYRCRENESYIDAINIVMYGRQASIGYSLYDWTVYSPCKYHALTSTKTIYRILANQLREQITRLMSV